MIFLTTIHNDDYIIRDHRVHGVRVIPGVTFIDMICRCLIEEGTDPCRVEFRDVLFVEPIATTNSCDKEIKITFAEQGEKQHVTIHSRKIISGQQDDGDQAAWNENMRCELLLNRPPHSDMFEKSSIDFNQLNHEATETIDLETVFAELRASKIHHYEFMKTLGKIYVAPSYMLAEVRLSDLAASYAEDFFLHPAFLDTSTIISFYFSFLGKKHTNPYIPFYIESFRPCHSLTDQCYIYVPQPDQLTDLTGKNEEHPQDIVYSNYGIYNAEHACVAKIKKIAAKRIRSESSMKKLESIAAPTAGKKAKTPAVPDQGKRKEFEKEMPQINQERMTQTELENDLTNMVAALLSQTDSSETIVDIHLGFYNQGLDSSHLLKLVRQIERAYDLKLYPTLLFEYTNIKELAQYLYNHCEIKKTQKDALTEEERFSFSSSSSPLEKTTWQYYQTDWKRSGNLRPDLAVSYLDEMRETSMVIFDLNPNLADTMLHALQRIPAHIVYVKPGDKFQRDANGRYQLNIHQLCDFQKLWKTLSLENRFPEHVICLNLYPDFSIEPATGTRRADERPEHADLNELKKELVALTFLSQSLMTQKNRWSSKAVNLCYFYTSHSGMTHPVHSALGGFFKTIRLENRGLQYKLIEISLETGLNQDQRQEEKLAAQIINILAIETRPQTRNQVEIRYSHQKRYVRQIKPMLFTGNESNPCWTRNEQQLSSLLKQDGNYLITGGAGEIGLLLAQYLVSCRVSKIILIGRSKLDSEKEKQIGEIASTKDQVLYIQADVTDQKSVATTIQNIQNTYGTINGVIHSAGVIRDKLLIQKERKDMDTVLDPKIFGAIHLDQALKDSNLDFFVTFSSTTALLGNIGQADYAYANAFMDAFMKWRADQHDLGHRHGRSISICWPYWKAGGMSLAADDIEHGKATWGIWPLNSDSGIDAFARMPLINTNPVIVWEGDQSKITQKLTEIQENENSDRNQAVGDDIPQSDKPNQIPFKDDPKIEVAIVGVSGRYPMANTIDQYWRNLVEGKDCISIIPKDRWDYRDYFSENKFEPGTSYSKWGGFIDDVDKFDPLFFNIAPVEAEMLDPQERLFLETVWHTIEDAGYAKSDLENKRVGVYVGIMWGQYQLFNTRINGKRVAPGVFFASVANRISYFFNFKGPSLAVDTMCSSSLTAIHLACESLIRHESELAIAGGVNLSLHPDKYNFLSRAKYVSSDGRCRSFGIDGDGYVPGEGVGAVLLKPLDRAIADGDHIYGIIKGSSLNHGGRTSGYSVPHPDAQADIIAETMAKAHVHPQSISYVEAHGTGTSLGDPIEISGLSKAFGLHADAQSCPIGSVKSNIGHLESAAGIASLTKVLLQMQYKHLVPSIHADQLNPHIDFENSPFHVQTEYAPWNRTVLKDEHQDTVFPRRAAISSFGAGGANAHLIIEEFESPYQNGKAHFGLNPDAWIIPLSARDNDQLLAYVNAFISYIENLKNRSSEKNEAEILPSMAYTLQIGREAMEVRLAFLVKTEQELLEKLKAYASDQKNIINAFSGQVDLRSASKILESGDTLIQNRQYAEIAQKWVAGYQIKWQHIYGDVSLQRMSLPVYPFAKERYWIGNGNVQENYIPAESNHLHPLIDVNTSTLDAQCYTKTLYPDTVFLRDHQVDQTNILPAVVALEMARAAGDMANAQQTVTCLQSVYWAQPIQASPLHSSSDNLSSAKQKVQIQLLPQANSIEFEISTRRLNAEKVIHTLGTLIYGGSSPKVDALDLAAVRKRTHSHWDRRQCYAMFTAYQFQYGPFYQSLRHVYVGEHEALAEIQLPEACLKDSHEFMLHPALMDGAMQTVMVLNDHSSVKPHVPHLPYAIARMDIWGPLPHRCYAYVTIANSEAPNSMHPPIDQKKYHLQLLDDQGNVVVQIEALSLRPIQTDATINQPVPDVNSSHLIYFHEVWQKSAPLKIDVSDHEKQSMGPVLLFSTYQPSAAKLEKQKLLHSLNFQRREDIIWVAPGQGYSNSGMNEYAIHPQAFPDYQKLMNELENRNLFPHTIIYMAPDQAMELPDQLEASFYPFVLLLQGILSFKKRSNVRCLYLWKHQKALSDAVHSAFFGFCQSITLENPHFTFKLIEIRNHLQKTGDVYWAPYADQIRAELYADHYSTQTIYYDQMERYSRRIAPLPVEKRISAPKEVAHYINPMITKEKTYLITGGLGGLGFIFADYIARQKAAYIYLTGRSKLSSRQKNKIKTLTDSGVNVQYIQSDISQKNEIENLYQQIQSSGRRLNGVIHSAGVVKDDYFIHKTTEQIASVLAPKIYGTVLLDAVFAQEPLDFFILFSSTAANFGNVGQTDYAFANRFLDNFSYLRNHWVEQKLRSGRTVSINWPFWQDGGMQINDSVRDWMKNEFGVVPLSKANGLMAFEQIMASTETNVIVWEGDIDQISKTIEKYSADSDKDTNLKEQIASGGDSYKTHWQGVAEDYLKEVISSEIKLAVDKINAKTPFETYGIDSVMIMNMTRQMEKQFGELSKTLFFEYQDVAQLATYLARHHYSQLEKMIGKTQQTEFPLISEKASAPSPRPFRIQNRSFPQKTVSQKDRTSTDDIAIIGITGRYPMAKNIEELWQNVAAGIDCITEIPKERWDYKTHYDPEKNVSGKNYCKWGGFIDDVDKFDPLFFNITPREAAVMDPQERLFLESVWHVLEDAGYTRDTLSNRQVGVFVGIMWSHYQLIGLEQYFHGNPVMAGSSYASVANRISHFFDFKGPSIAIDTMCSSSLTAIHLACSSIIRNECQVAIAGGVNLSIHPMKYNLLSHGGYVASDGKCRSFGEGGDGYVPGEGVGSVLLKRLEQAEADGDHIYAVIKATAINHNGHTNGYTTPDPVAQSIVVRDALSKADIDSSRINYIEAHGTGTALGDPIEITGLVNAFKWVESKTNCKIGSVKSNIGHLESAAGIAGLSKVVMQMQAKKIAPSLHADPLNSNINFNKIPFEVQKTLTDWEKPFVEIDGRRQMVPRCAGISSFGAGGANGHIILEEYQAVETRAISDAQQDHIFIFSAKNRNCLLNNISDFIAFLKVAMRRYTSPPSNAGQHHPGRFSDFSQQIKNILADILHVAQSDLGEEDILIELGVDQIVLTSLADQLQAYYEIDIDRHFLEGHATLKLLTVAVWEKYSEKIQVTEVEKVNPNLIANRNTIENYLEHHFLADMAYTLQVGREAMEERLAIVASNLKDLISKLSAFLNDTSENQTVYMGNVKAQKSQLEAILGGRSGIRLAKMMIDDNDLAALARLWIMGLELDWTEVRTKSHNRDWGFRRISMPTYSFEKVSCWITDFKAGYQPSDTGTASYQNKSHQDEQQLDIGNHHLSGQSQDFQIPIKNFLKQKIASIAKFDADEMDIDEAFIQYGIDSIEIGQFITQMEKIVGPLPKTLLHDYATITQLSDYFELHHSEQLRSVLNSKGTKRAYADGETGHSQKSEATPKKDSNHIILDERVHEDDIAIIGLSGRYPQAQNIDQFWQNIKSGRHCLKTIPGERWDINSYFDPDPRKADLGKMYCKWGGFLDDVDKFDPLFFNISPREAELMDPQERLFIETAYAALEDAGYAKHDSDVGVFVGVTTNSYQMVGYDYYIQQVKEGVAIDNTQEEIPVLNSSIWSVANRVSYALNLSGPSMPVDTACSSSLTAIHLACSSLKNNECQMALAGGVNLYLHPVKYVGMCQMGLLSKTDRCHVFGSEGDGFIPGEGVGAVLLKPLEAAIADKDHIYAVIKGSIIRHGGRSEGYTIPNPHAQTKLLTRLLKQTHINHQSISYVESSANGSLLADSIEFSGLCQGFQSQPSGKNKIAIGSVKANIGHLESAAGISQLTKVVLQMKHQQLAPTIITSPLNSEIHIENSPFYLQSQLTGWAQPSASNTHGNLVYPRRALINAIGAGGSNVQMIIEEYREDSVAMNTSTNPSSQLFIFSARTKAQLLQVLQQVADFLKVNPNLSIKDMAYTLRIGRSSMRERLAIIASEQNLLLEAMGQMIDSNLGQYVENQTHQFKVYQKNEDDPDTLPHRSKPSHTNSGFHKAFPIGELLKNEQLDLLAKLWVNGADFDWRLLPKNEAKRISLPTYPFEKRSYWSKTVHDSNPDSGRREQSGPVILSATAISTRQAVSSNGKELSQILKEVASHFLKLPKDEIDENTDLKFYGFDSLVGIRLANRIQKLTDTAIDMRSFLTSQTINEMISNLSVSESSATVGLQDVNQDAFTPLPERPHDNEPEQNGNVPGKKYMREEAGTITHPLTEGQKALWMSYQLAPTSYAYNFPAAYKIDKDADLVILRAACQFLMERHPCLRSTFLETSEGPIQKISNHPEVDFEIIDGSSMAINALEKIVQTKAQEPFDIEHDTLMRIHVFKGFTPNPVVLFNFHHLIFDGLSLALFLDELQQVYRALSQKQIPRLPEIKAEYRDFLYYQRQMLEKPAGQSHLEYWKNILSGELKPLELPYDRAPSQLPATQGSSYVIETDQHLFERIKTLARSENVSHYAIMLTAFYGLLFRITHQTDLIIGTPMAGRPDENFEQVIGFFANMVVMRMDLASDPSCRSLLHQVQEQTLDALLHSEYPYYKLIQEIKTSPPQIRSHLFQTAFYFQNWIKALNISLSEAPTDPKPSLLHGGFGHIYQLGEFDFVLEVAEHATQFFCNFKYNPALFDAATIQRLAACYINFLNEMVLNPGLLISKIEILSASDKLTLLNDLNQTDLNYPQDVCVHELFERQAQRVPHNIAVIYEDQRLTYNSLNHKASLLAQFLSNKGVDTGTFVGVFMQPSLEMMVALLGILKAGGVYVPLDPSYPGERIIYMLEDTQTTIVLTQSFTRQKFPDYPAQTFSLDHDWDWMVKELDKSSQLEEEPSEKDTELKHAGPKDLAYIIYTSGSTGKPKGVQIYHQSLTNLLWSVGKRPGCVEEDCILALTTICFDIAGVELFLPLIKGAKIEMLPADVVKDGMKLKERLEKSTATIYQATPATWQMLIAAGWNPAKKVKIITAGEALSRELADALLDRSNELWNGYGPTENTIYTTLAKIERDKKVTIGRPVHNNQLYILDRFQNVVPLGVLGELYIGGDGLSKGYLNRPELNQEKFIENPFQKDSEDLHKPAQLYRTGDLVRYLPDGNIDYLGRIDSQIKLRGFRIELGEIETAIRKELQIQEVAVVLREDTKNHKRLVGFIVVRDKGTPIITENIKKALNSWLPNHMIPSEFVLLSEMPQTLSRKIDRNILAGTDLALLKKRYGLKTPRADRLKRQDDYDKQRVDAPPKKTMLPTELLIEQQTEIDTLVRGCIAEEITACIADILDVGPDKIDSGTMLGEYGFDSILFTTLSSKLRNTFDVSINPTEFYSYGTIQAIAAHLNSDFRPRMRQKYAGLIARVAPSAPDTGVRPAAQPSDKFDRSTPFGELKALATGHPRGAVAIIGMSGRMPKSKDLYAFWGKLVNSDEFISEIPQDRWDFTRYDGDSSKEYHSDSKWGAFIDDIYRFDNAFFGISPKEAEFMDPQQRILMEVIWHTIEDAGYKPSDLSGTRTGIYIGATSLDFSEMLGLSGLSPEAYTLTGLATTILPNRISYYLNLKGPSIHIDTACSSSLVAVHQAVTAINNGLCQSAIVGGVNIMLSPTSYVGLSKINMLSPDGRSKVFDESANGYVRGEGALAVWLKPLDQALAEDDHIYGIIRGSAENHGGRTNSITAPNPNAQSELIISAVEQAGIDPATISYIETHGTGTALGDPIEINGLKDAFNQLYLKWGKTAPTEPHCGLGSVKSNIGHLEGAAGLAGLVKVILALQHKVLPGNLHFKTQNPYIDLTSSPFYIQNQTKAWPRGADEDGNKIPLRAGVSSFGFGGVNAHVVIEEYLAQNDLPKKQAESSDVLIVLSASKVSVLKNYARDLAAYIQRIQIDPHLANDFLRRMAYTLQVGREEMTERMTCVVSDLAELKEVLTRFGDGQTPPDRLFQGNVKKNQMQSSLLVDGAAGQAFLNALVEHKDLQRLAQLWVLGVNINFRLLYHGQLPQKISLSGYPFQKTIHLPPHGLNIDALIERKRNQGRIVYKDASKTLSPLIDHNQSLFDEQIFQKTFTGTEFFLEDHVVNQRKVLPAVISIEMARAAGNLSSKKLRVQEIQDVIWERPVVVDSTPPTLSIRLNPVEQVRSPQLMATYEIRQVTDYDQPQIHSRGKLVFYQDHTAGPNTIPASIDIASIRKRGLNQKGGSECYQVFKNNGFQYGAGMQVLQELSYNEQEGLGKMQLPSNVSNEQTGIYGLHPALMDGAIQSVIGLMNEAPGAQKRLFMPFAVKRIQIRDAIPPSCYAYVRSAGEPLKKGRLHTFNITITDVKGRVLVQVEEMALKGVLAQTVQTVDETKHAIEEQAIPSAAKIEPRTKDVQSDLKAQTIAYLSAVMAEETKFSMEDIEPDEDFEKLGLDSIMVVKLTRRLEDKLGQLSKTLFFEYLNLNQLSEYFIAHHKDTLTSLFASAQTEQADTIDQIDPDLNNPSPTGTGTDFKSVFKSPHIDWQAPVNTHQDPIAIIGIDGRFPQADNLTQFWKNLKEGKDCITEIPKERWDFTSYFDPQKGRPGKAYTKWGSFIDDVDCFDPLFFSISPREAEIMDPQERLFLQCAWKAVEDAGYNKKRLSLNRVGVYVGVMWGQYQLWGPELSQPDHRIGLSSSYASIANRVSYCLNLAGPSMAIDTMCSSSLTSIHLACESIKRNECQMAIAGGVNLSLHPNKDIILSQGRFASSDGRCKSFGEGGDGYVPGEGIGAVVLKSLQQALDDKDHIYALIKGSALNHGGKTNGYSVPNLNAQADLVRRAMQQAQIEPESISYIEAHGTGTALGDPIEINALAKAFGKYTPEKQFCAIGSIKSNIGHLESAAGIAGIAKVVLQMRHKQLVPSIHSDILNTNIDFKATPFYVQRELNYWEKPSAYPRRASISAFGAGGANAHFILEEYETHHADQEEFSPGPQLIIFSANTKESLLDLLHQYLYFIETEDLLDAATPPSKLAEMAFTLQTGREELSARVAIAVSDFNMLYTQLKAYVSTQKAVKPLYLANVADKSAKRIRQAHDPSNLEKLLNQPAPDLGTIDQLAQIWVVGVKIDWERLHSGHIPRRISLPTYPFAKEKYWVPMPDKIDTANRLPRLHPLIEQNTSTLIEQRYSTRLSKNDFVIRDHVVGGQLMLPGAAYLEIARAAGELAGQKPIKRILDTVWIKPVVLETSEQVIHIRIEPVQDRLKFQVLTDGKDGRPVTHATGQMVYKAGLEIVPDMAPLDIQAIKNRSDRSLTAKDCYDAFMVSGLQYGEGFQSVQKLVYNQFESLAWLTLPKGVSANEDAFVLHPSLIDGALQTLIGLLMFQSKTKPAFYLPFSIGALEIIKPVPHDCIAYLSIPESIPGKKDKTDALDIGRQPLQLFIADLDGNIAVKLEKILFRPLPAAFKKDANGTGHASLTAIAEPSDGASEDDQIRKLLIQLENGTLAVDEMDKQLKRLESGQTDL